jgi:hypothetical protein
MGKATLYFHADMASASNLEVELSETEEKKFQGSSGTDGVVLELVVLSGSADLPGEVFIQPQYDKLSTMRAGALEEVRVLRVNGKHNFRPGLYPENTKIQVSGLYIVDPDKGN